MRSRIDHCLLGTESSVYKVVVAGKCMEMAPPDSAKQPDLGLFPFKHRIEQLLPISMDE